MGADAAYRLSRGGDRADEASSFDLDNPAPASPLSVILAVADPARVGIVIDAV
jgi:hypothetical protein